MRGQRSFTARYFKHGGKYYGYVLEFGADAIVTGRTLAETKAKLREALARAIREEPKNRIYGKPAIEETITVKSPARGG